MRHLFEHGLGNMRPRHGNYAVLESETASHTFTPIFKSHAHRPVPEFVVCGIGQVQNSIERQSQIGAPLDAIVSITDFYMEEGQGPRDAFGNSLSLLSAGKSLSLEDKHTILDFEDDPKFTADLSNHTNYPISRNDIERALQAVQKVQDTLERPARILVHCHVGDSRSTAVTMALLYKHLKDADHPHPAQEAAQRLEEARPGVLPNPAILAAFDEYFSQSPAGEGPLFKAAHANRDMKRDYETNDGIRNCETKVRGLRHVRLIQPETERAGFQARFPMQPTRVVKRGLSPAP